MLPTETDLLSPLDKADGVPSKASKTAGPD